MAIPSTPSVQIERSNSLNLDKVGTIPAFSGLSVEETGEGIVRQAVLTFTNFTVSLVDNGATGSGGRKIYDFPAGQVCILGGVADLTATSDLTTDAGLVFSSGTVTAAADGTLTSTEANIIASTAAPLALGAATPKGIAPGTLAFIDGTAVSAAAFINFASANDPVGNKTLTLNGKLAISWLNLGDK